MQTLKRRRAPAGTTGKRRSRKRLSRPKISGRRLLLAAVAAFLLISVGRSVLPIALHEIGHVGGIGQEPQFHQH